MARSKVGKTVVSLGDYLREQRVAAELSLRQLADQAGVSNPYLSQIERGLRRPSADVLQQLAKALRISAEQLYLQAGIVSPEIQEVRSVELAVLGDPELTERQKHALLDVYQAFREVTAAARPQGAETSSASSTPDPDLTSSGHHGHPSSHPQGE